MHTENQLKYFKIIIVFQGLGLLTCSVQNLFSVKRMNLFGQLVGLLGRGINPTQGLYLQTGQHNTEKRGHTSIARVRFEPRIPEHSEIGGSKYFSTR